MLRDPRIIGILGGVIDLWRKLHGISLWLCQNSYWKIHHAINGKTNSLCRLGHGFHSYVTNYQRVNEIKFLDFFLNLQKWDRLGACPVAPEDNLICPHPWGFICRDVIQKWQNIDFYVFFYIIASYLNILFSLRKLLVSYRSITPKIKPLCRESCPQRGFPWRCVCNRQMGRSTTIAQTASVTGVKVCLTTTEIPKIASKRRWTISPMDPMGLGLGFKSMLLLALLALLGTALEYIGIHLEIWVACNHKSSFSVSTFLQTDCLGADLLLYQGRWKQRRPCVCSKECTLQSKFAYCNP